MANLSELYKELISILEKNINDKGELEKVKSKLSEIMISFVDSLNSLMDVKDRQEEIEKKLRKIQRKIENIEEDIYIEDDGEDEEPHDQMHDNDYEFEIRCPYCDEDFIISEDSKKLVEIECPRCHNIIELDWNDCSDCKGCANGCSPQYEEEQATNDKDQVKGVAEEETAYGTEDDEQNTNNDSTKEQGKKQDNSNNANHNENEDDDM